MSIVIQGKIPLQDLYLNESDGIPFDITFRIIEDETISNEEIEKGQTGIDIKAHKFVLAAYSTVFKAMFYGPMKENREVIPVKQTTIEAFRKLVSYFYELQIDGNAMTVVEIFEVMNLAERYAVPDLKQELEKLLQTIPITRENLMDTAEAAYHYSVFDAPSSALLLKCAQFFCENITSASETVEIMCEQYGRGEGAVNQKLFSLVRSLESAKCGNCGEVSCLNGQVVVEFRQGLKVKRNMASSTVKGYFKTRGLKRIVAVVDSIVDINNYISVRFERSSNSIPIFVPSSLDGVPTFCYNC